MIKRGEAFVKKWPQSAFGDDNKQPFEEFKTLVRMAKEGKSIKQLRTWVEEEYSDEEDEDERMRLEGEATSHIDWLEGSDDDPYPEEL